MNKDNFLMRLEQLLYEIPREEREEAMDYYRSYFDDAGPENEAAVIEELESPQMIADSIIEALNSTGDMTGALKNPPQVRESQSNTGEHRQTAEGGRQSAFEGASAQTSGGYQDTSDSYQDTSGADYQKTSGRAFYKRYDQYGTDRGRHGLSGMDKRTKLILVIIAAVFLLPVWRGLLSGVVGIIGAVIGVIAALGIFSAGGIIGGVICTAAAIVSLCTMAIARGLLLLGTGMLLIAAGGLSIVLLLLLCGRLLPWAVRQVMRVFHWMVQWGRSAA